ncbi:MAG: hypothetical protein HN976_06825 [Lentisphaerae bacterium]|nr:hypothetical protein [Lentisphaerota bacterium]MBT7054785.1 hypothetical protein [Lentisphaerota bacterium]
MKHVLPTLSVLAILSPGVAGQLSAQPVENETYLTGAWFAPRDDAERAMYLKGGFTMVPYARANVEWAREHDLVYIAGVNAYGLPPTVARPFEEAGGARSMSVGLFTHINFNAPSVEAWWQTRVPEQVEAMKDRDRVRFWKVHNEFGYHSGATYDYSPGSLSRYRHWLKERYRTIDELNEKWGSSHVSFAVIEPPRSRAEMTARLANWLEWRRFTCWNFADYFRTTGDLIRRVCPNAAVSDNFYTTSPMQGWDNFELARQADYLAYDIYEAQHWPRLLTLLEHARTGADAWDKPFIIMEYHAGPNHRVTEVTHGDLTIEASVALARECRALQWFRWIPGGGGREQGIHGMMDSQGKPTERFTAAAEVSAFCQRLAPLLRRARTVTETAVLTSSDAVYLAHARRASVWAERNRWDQIAAILGQAGLQTDQIDPKRVVGGALDRYRVIIAGHVEVLSEAAWRKLHEFVATGGTLILHPDVGLLNAYGRPRDRGEGYTYTDTGTVDGPWTVRGRVDGRAECTIEEIGQGRIVHCAWELPRQRPELDACIAMQKAYLDLLAEYAGVAPVWQLRDAASVQDIDCRLLETGSGALLFATWLGGGQGTVSLKLPTIRRPSNAYLLNSRSARVVPLAARLTSQGLVLPPIPLDPAGVVLIADRPWQPVVGIDVPKELHPGDVTTATVTIDNLGRKLVGGQVRLSVPPSWEAVPIGDAHFADLPSDGRATAAFRVSVPAEAALDFFAVDNPMEATVTLKQGRSGTVAATHLPFVLPALDVRLVYDGRALNPFQEMVPPVLRWGWDREVITPTAPPVSFGADAPLTAHVRVGRGLVGKKMSLRVTGPGKPTISPKRTRISGAHCEIPCVVNLPRPGVYSVVATSEGTSAEVTVNAGVHTETVGAASNMTGELPPGWKHLGAVAIGARDSAAAGVPVSVTVAPPLAAPERVAAFDRTGHPVAAAISSRAVELAVDVAKDSVASFFLAEAPADAGPGSVVSRVHLDRPDDRTVIVRGDRYAVCFDTALGIVRWYAFTGQTRVPMTHPRYP